MLTIEAGLKCADLPLNIKILCKNFTVDFNPNPHGLKAITKLTASG
jgi:hypothetical protein